MRPVSPGTGSTSVAVVAFVAAGPARPRSCRRRGTAPSYRTHACPGAIAHTGSFGLDDPATARAGSEAVAGRTVAGTSGARWRIRTWAGTAARRPRRPVPRAGRRRRMCGHRAGSPAPQGRSRRPSTIALVAGSIRETYRGSPSATLRPLRCPTVNPAAPSRSPTRLPSASNTGPRSGPSRRATAVRRGSHRPGRSRSPGSRACLRHQVEAARDGAHLGLGQVAQREPAVRTAGPGAGHRGSRSGPCRRPAPGRASPWGPPAVSTTTRRA